MRHPDGWGEEYSYEEKQDIRKRQRRSSHSSDREKRPRRYHHYKTYERCPLDSKKLERRAQEPSVERESHGAKERDGAKAEPCKERRNRDWHHYSKSSARSGRSHQSSRTRHRSRRHSQGRSDSV